MSEFPLGMIVVGLWLVVVLLVVYVDAQTSHDPKGDPVTTPAASRRRVKTSRVRRERAYCGEKLKA